MDREDASTATRERVLSVFETSGSGEPHTAREVADAVGCARTAAGEELQRLTDAGVLETKEVSARTRVWWAPPEPTDAEPAPRPGSQEGQGHDARARESQFRAVFREAFDAIMIVDDEGRYVEVNPAACELFGLPEDRLLGRTIEDFAAEGYDFERAWEDFVESDLEKGLFPLVRADGEHRIVEFAATPNILPGRHLSVIRDVTERRAARDALEQERERTAQYQRTLTAETAIELEFRTAGEWLLDDLSGELDCGFEFEGVVSTSDGRSLEYVRATGASPETLRERLTGARTVSEFRTVYESDSSTLLELDLDRSPVQTLVETGASPRSMRTAGGVTTVVAEIGAEADLQRPINGVCTAYPGTTVVAKRTLDRSVSPGQYGDSPATDLTDRQLETLRAAFLGGYFEWPRDSGAEELASSMGIAASTWLRHLRLAESKLVGWLFEELEV